MTHPNVSPVISYSFPADKKSSIYRLQVNGVEIPVTEFPDIGEDGYERIASSYRQMPPHCWVEARFMAVHYAHLACAGPVEVTVAVPQDIQKISISPKRKRFKPTLTGNVLRFTVEQNPPAYLILEFDQLPLLCILVDPPESDVPLPGDRDVVDASQFLTDASGKIDQTGAFRKAIQAVNGTGKILFIPSGVYLTGTIKIHRASNMKIYFAPGSLIRIKKSPPGANRHSHGIWIHESQDLTLFGPGCVDHQAYENFRDGRNNYKDGLVSWAVANDSCPYTTMSPLFISRSRNISVERLTVRNSRNFNYNVRRSDNVTFRYCKGITPPACIPEYTDGFNINSCQGFLIEDCFVFCNDDCFATGHYFYSYDDRESSHQVIRGLVGWNPRANGVRIGFWAHYDLGDITFEDCDFINPDDSGILIHPLRDAPEADRYPGYGTIRFQDCGFDHANRMIYGMILVDKPRIRKLELINLTFDEQAPHPSRIEGSAQGKIREIVIKNLVVGGEPCTDLAGAGIVVNHVDRIFVDGERQMK